MTFIVPRGPSARPGLRVEPGLSVIVPAHEDTPVLRRALWSVEQTADVPYELVVACERRSVARNRNAGLDRARGDLVAFLDDDVLLPAHWMSRLLERLLARADVGAVSAHLVFPDGAPQTRRPDLGPDELWDVPLPGTCFVYSRARVDDQRFDEGYEGSQWEDTDWMWRTRARGLRTLMTGAVRVVHDHALRENRWLEHNMRRFERVWGRLPRDDETCAVTTRMFAAWHPPPLDGGPAR